MTTALRVARIATLIALLGFAFPWVLVSCEGEPVGRLSGFNLATGGLPLQVSASSLVHEGHPDLWVTLSLAAVIAGLFVSILVKSRAAIVGLLTAAAIALVASAIGVASLGSGARVADQPTGQSAGAGGQTQLQYGYFITVIGLLTAIGACGAALARRQDAPP